MSVDVEREETECDDVVDCLEALDEGQSVRVETASGDRVEGVVANTRTEFGKVDGQAVIETIVRLTPQDGESTIEAPEEAPAGIESWDLRYLSPDATADADELDADRSDEPRIRGDYYTPEHGYLPTSWYEIVDVETVPRPDVDQCRRCRNHLLYERFGAWYCPQCETTFGADEDDS